MISNMINKADENPLVSVILPVYNIAEYLPVCMDSLFAQTYANLELILVDDGSTDGSGRLCDEFAQSDPRVMVFHKPNGGLSDARNYGVSKAHGAYITFVDSDDYVDVDYVDYLYQLIVRYSVQMSVCQLRVSRNGRLSDAHKASMDEMLSSRQCIEKMLYHDKVDASACAKLYSASLFKGIGFPLGKQFEDIATTHKLMMRAGSIAVGYEEKYTYVMRADSIVNIAFNPHKLDLLEMTDGMAREVEEVWPDLKDATLRRRVYARFSTLNQMLDTQEYPEERQAIIHFIRENARAILHDPKAPKRDKLAILTLSLGYTVYRWVWKAYMRVK